jgi:hypothetical protein
MICAAEMPTPLAPTATPKLANPKGSSPVLIACWADAADPRSKHVVFERWFSERGFCHDSRYIRILW